MIYGYAIVVKKRDGWYDDAIEWYKLPKVRLFATEKDRDNAFNIEQKKDYCAEIAKFETKEKQGGLTILKNRF